MLSGPTRVAPRPSGGSTAEVEAVTKDGQGDDGWRRALEGLMARTVKPHAEMAEHLLPVICAAVTVWAVGIAAFAATADVTTDVARAFYSDRLLKESIAAAGAFYAVAYTDLTLISFQFKGSRASLSAPRAAVMVVCLLAGTTQLLHALKLLPIEQPAWSQNPMPPAKMYTWISTNVLLIFSLAEVLQLSQPAVFSFMAMQACCAITGLWSLYVASPWCWILLVISSIVFMPFVVAVLYISVRLRSLVSLVQSEALRFIGVSTALLWCVFPVLFFLGAAGAISAPAEAQAFIFLDLVTKLVFSTAVMGYKFKEDAEGNLRQVMHLTDANKAQRQFLRYVFHEVRVPFNSVVLGIEYLLMEESMVEYHGLLNTMKQAGETMSRTLDDVLSLAKIEEGKLQLEQRVFYLRAVMNNTLQQFRPGLEAKGLRLRYGYDSSIPLALIGDDHRLAQVLSNFVSNAIKFSRGGSDVEVMVLRREHNDLKCNVEITVADWGVGISAEDQRSLFQAFSQIRPGDLQKSRGSGLGLAIAKHIVELQGGRITLDSKENVGSRFTVVVPFGVAAASESPRQAVVGAINGSLGNFSSFSNPAAAALIAAQGSSWPERSPNMAVEETPPQQQQQRRQLAAAAAAGEIGALAHSHSLSDVPGLLPTGARDTFRAVGTGGLWGPPLAGAGAAAGVAAAGGGASSSPVPVALASAGAAPAPPAATAAMEQMAVIFQQYCEALDHMLLQTVRVALPFAASTAAGQQLQLNPLQARPWSPSNNVEGQSGASSDAAVLAARQARGGTDSSVGSVGSDGGTNAAAVPAENFQNRAAGIVQAMEAAVVRRRREGLETLTAVREALVPPGGAASAVDPGIPKARDLPVPVPAAAAGASPMLMRAATRRASGRGLAGDVEGNDDPDALTALVVDDVLSNRSLVMMLLRRLGWRCDSAANGQEAVEAAARRRYDIILMDNVMPVMTGVEATAAIKRATPDAVIVGVTGNALEEDKLAFREAGAREVLTKPIRKESLQQQLDIIKEDRRRLQSLHAGASSPKLSTSNSGSYRSFGSRSARSDSKPSSPRGDAGAGAGSTAARSASSGALSDAEKAMPLPLPSPSARPTEVQVLPLPSASGTFVNVGPPAAGASSSFSFSGSGGGGGGGKATEREPAAAAEAETRQEEGTHSIPSDAASLFVNTNDAAAATAAAVGAGGDSSGGSGSITAMPASLVLRAAAAGGDSGGGLPPLQSPFASSDGASSPADGKV